MSRPLTDFMATLHKNGIEEKKLAKYVTHSTLDDIVTFIIKWVRPSSPFVELNSFWLYSSFHSLSFPEEGQYGLDIYTRELGAPQHHHHNNNNINSNNNHNNSSTSSGEKHLLTHCCKYLINSSKRNWSEVQHDAVCCGCSCYLCCCFRCCSLANKMQY